MNERYVAYLTTTDNPTNWDFMAFIDKMVCAYLGIRDSTNGHIEDQDDFTRFILEQVS